MHTTLPAQHVGDLSWYWQSFAIPPKPTLSQWADAHRFLSLESNPTGGRWETATVPYLKEVMDTMSDEVHETVVVQAPSQFGKALALDTPIPTPNGWKMMGDLTVGDAVFDERGKPCKVTSAFPVRNNRNCYRVKFSDGSEIVADAEHRWYTQTCVPLIPGRAGAPGALEGVWTTQRIADTVNLAWGRKKRNTHAIPVAKPLRLSHKALPVDPYMLGVWLGDGNSYSAQITVHRDDVEMARSIEALGHRVTVRQKDKQTPFVLNLHIDPVVKDLVYCGRGHNKEEEGLTKKGHCAECARQYSKHFQYDFVMDPVLKKPDSLSRSLSSLGVMRGQGKETLRNHKHIPTPYLRASYRQRLALLQGLMDTDGSCDTRGYLEWSTTHGTLAEGMYELLVSLGIKPNVYRISPRTRYKGQLVYGQPAWRVRFTAYRDVIPVFRLVRKLTRMMTTDSQEKAPRRTSETFRRRIIAVDPVPSVPVRCISVDSPSHLYLAGKAMIPTHNSEAVLNLVGYIMDCDPGPVLLIQETIENARSWSHDRLMPMLRDTPVLRGKISTARGIRQSAEDVTSNQALHKSFPGGHITMVGSNSGAGLSLRPIRYVVADELDAWELSAGEEGDQLSLAEKRTTWFVNRKIVVISSPRLKVTSRIEPLYLRSDQRKLFLPCPHCGAYQELLFPRMKWETGPDGMPVTDSVHFPCVQCHRRIEEGHRRAMLAACEWRASFPGRPIAGFHGWAAHCPPIPWAKIATEHVTDHKDPEKYKVFVNTRLAETWEEPSDAPGWEPLKERALVEGRLQWTVPAGVGFLTIGADVQGDRLEYSVWGWGPGSESWLIGHEVVYGNTDTEDPYLEFERRAFIPYQQPSRGRTLSPLLAGLDTGYNAQEVYWFCRTRPHIYPIKGASPAQAPAVASPTWQDIDYKGRKIKSGVQLWTLGVHRIKKQFYGRLRLKIPGPRFVHFPCDLADPDEYFRQITAERMTTTMAHGYPRQEWKKTYDNEALDTAIYAYAVAVLAGLEDPRTDWRSLCPGYVPEPVPVVEPRLEEVTMAPARQTHTQPMTVAPARAVTLPAPVIPVRARGVRGGAGLMARLLRR